MRTDGKVRRSIHRGGATSLLLALAVAAGCSNEPTEPPPGFEEQPGNQAPVANAGADQTVSARMTALLNGSASTDADGDDLAFSWTIVGPEGSTAEPNTPTARTTTFVPDVPGEYVATLIVDDGMETHSATVTITAEDNTIRQTVGTEGGRLESDEFGFILDPVVADLLGPTVLSVTTATEAQREAAIFEEELELALGGSADLFGRPDAAWRVEVEAEDGSDGGDDLSWVFTHRAEE